MTLVDTYTNIPIAGKLGRAGTKIDPRTLRYETYRPAKLVSPPAAVDNSQVVSNWGMLLNDSLGDCVPAGALHADELFSAKSGYKTYTYQDPDALKVYEAVGGYVQGDPSTDNGCYLIDMLNYWVYPHTGLPVTGHKLNAFVSGSSKNAGVVKSIIYEFDLAYIGLNLPISAQSQKIWDVPSTGTRGNGAPGSWGGHCVILVGYDSKHLAFITWGGVMLMTWAFLGTYCDELYALLSYDLMMKGESPLGLNLTQLKADLSQL